MNLYLDDDCASHLLAQLLSAAGHDVQRPVKRLEAAHPSLTDQIAVLNQWR
jgi:hypothetical protein